MANTQSLTSELIIVMGAVSEGLFFYSLRTRASWSHRFPLLKSLLQMTATFKGLLLNLGDGWVDTGKLTTEI